MSENVQIIPKKRKYTKRTPTPTPKPRVLEELENVPYKLLTREELELVAENMHDELLLARNKIIEFTKGYETLCKENSNLKTHYQNLRGNATQQLNYFKEQAAMLYRTALLIKNLED